MIMPMPIQSQVYPYNANGFSAGGVIDFNFNSQQKPHPHQQHGPVDPSALVHNSNGLPSLENAMQDIDRFIGFQNEQLRLIILEKENEYAAAMLKDVKSQSLRMLRKKDEEIALVANKRMELEHFIKKLEAENWIWKKEAQDKEAMALSLYTALEEQKKIIASSSHHFVANDDAESHWDETNGGNEEMGEEAGTGEKKAKHEEQSTRKDVMVCKSCHSRRSCFLFLPCRHLASCKYCDAVLKACPVCGVAKKSSIETLNF